MLADWFRSTIVWRPDSAAILSFLFREPNGTLAIIAEILINAAIGFSTELKVLRSMDALSRIAKVATKVRRGGRVVEIPALDMVPRDIVLLDGGVIVNADLGITEAAKLQADESILTGEAGVAARLLEGGEEALEIGNPKFIDVQAAGRNAQLSD